METERAHYLRTLAALYAKGETPTPERQDHALKVADRLCQAAAAERLEADRAALADVRAALVEAYARACAVACPSWAEFLQQVFPCPTTGELLEPHTDFLKFLSTLERRARIGLAGVPNKQGEGDTWP